MGAAYIQVRSIDRKLRYVFFSEVIVLMLQMYAFEK